MFLKKGCKGGHSHKVLKVRNFMVMTTMGVGQAPLGLEER